jgi:cell division protein YceG involved in septum cleavage
MLDTATAPVFGVPGPTLEGYLYPATYVVPGRPLDEVIARMVHQYLPLDARAPGPADSA